MSEEQPHHSRLAAERDHFDRLAETIKDTWWGSETVAGKRRLRLRAEQLANYFDDREESCILEVGAGTGTFLQHALASLKRVSIIASDLSPKCAKIAQERYQSERSGLFIHVADATQLPFPAASVDGVYGCSILHHLPLGPSLQEFFRVLKPGGRMWLSEPNMMNPQIAAERNLRFIGRRLQVTEDETAFFRWSLAKALRSAGFEEVHVHPFDFLHPGTPPALIAIVEALGNLLEHTPVIREIAGSLQIQARKPE